MLRMETRWSRDETMAASIDVDVVGGEGTRSDAEILREEFWISGGDLGWELDRRGDRRG